MASHKKFLLSRSSADVKKLTEPAPSGKDLKKIMKAAMRAPDHKCLRPWDYRIIQGDSRERLGELFAKALEEWEDDPTDEEREKLAKKALRAPLMIAGIVRGVPNHPKVPMSEQIASVSCGMYSMLLMAQALGYGAIWLSGPMAYSTVVTEAFDIGEDDTMMGFLYIGTPEKDLPAKRRPRPNEFFSEWEG
jgi:nitroreductase